MWFQDTLPTSVGGDPPNNQCFLCQTRIHHLICSFKEFLFIQSLGFRMSLALTNKCLLQPHLLMFYWLFHVVSTFFLINRSLEPTNQHSALWWRHWAHLGPNSGLSWTRSRQNFTNRTICERSSGNGSGRLRRHVCHQSCRTQGNRIKGETLRNLVKNIGCCFFLMFFCSCKRHCVN